MNSLFGRHFTLFISCPFLIICFFFFFSSRRRHTRWPRDWSSDVCSSDLLFLSHVDAERERGSGREAFRPGSEQRLHSTRAPDSRMARPHLATSDSTNAPNVCGVELIASTPNAVKIGRASCRERV